MTTEPDAGTIRILEDEELEQVTGAGDPDSPSGPGRIPREGDPDWPTGAD